MNVAEKQLREASYAALRAHPITKEAEDLVHSLADLVDSQALASGARKNKRRKTSEKLVYAVGAFLADLLRPHGSEASTLNGWVYRSMHAQSFNGQAVSYRNFISVVDGLTLLGFLEHVDGHRLSREGDDPGKYASRFRASAALLALCQEHSVEPTRAADHFEFEYELPKEVIELRATRQSKWWQKEKPAGEPMKFERDGVTQAIEDQVRELNDFFAKQKLRGGSHHGYVRMFNKGDDPRFYWNMGGRLYSQHFAESYQLMNSEKRRRMTINDEPVAEIDISASYLTIFLSVRGVQLPEGDPYDLPGLGPEHRTAVKSWMVASLSSSKPIVRWPRRMLAETPELKEYRPATITPAALAKYPALKTMDQPLSHGTYGWAGLMWFESNVMIAAMLELKRTHQVPSLVVHDSLIVQVSAAEIARAELEKAFQSQRGVKPRLKINPPTKP